MLKEYVGVGSLGKLPSIIQSLHPRSIFLVTGKSSYEKLNKKFTITSLLGNRKITTFQDFQQNPTIDDVKRGVSVFKKAQPDLVIAIGGGSAIDVAKAIHILAKNSDTPERYLTGEAVLSQKGSTLIAIPTTAGTGSEVTRFAVINIKKTKYSLSHELLIPDYAIVDPDLSVELPKKISATTGLDAFSQCVESLWSNKSTDESKKYAREGIQLLWPNLKNAVLKPTLQNKTAVARGAYLSGKAINISMTTACHAISYPITSRFGVPHGFAVALTLSSMLVYNSKVQKRDVQDTRGVGYVKNTIDELTKLMGERTPEKAAEKIVQLMKQIGAPTRLSDIGVITDKDLNYIIEHGFNPQRVKNNPRKLTRDALQEMLTSLR